MKKVQAPATIAKYLPAFVTPKSDYRELFKCIKYTGEYGVATNTTMMLIFPSKIPAMLQNYYTREPFDGVFPDITKVIPTEIEYSTSISREVAGALVNATTCASSFFDKHESGTAAMSLDFADGTINVICKTTDREMKTAIKAKCQGTFSINFNPARFIHVVRCAYDFCKLGDEIRFDFAGELNVAAISVGDIKMILAPMRVDW